jgi:hypothetical protein
VTRTLERVGDKVRDPSLSVFDKLQVLPGGTWLMTLTSHKGSQSRDGEIPLWSGKPEVGLVDGTWAMLLILSPLPSSWRVRDTEHYKKH